mmetsp:Transcript_9582/g.28654  ORF Transcript_9582/g.28654 Transcript_9582/m.28654 type:complete len:194 (+) Transcript_9582:181-762(+)
MASVDFSDDGSGGHDGFSDDGGEEAAPRASGHLGAAALRILGKDTGAQDPVLAKRKTPLMRELEADRAARQLQKKRRLEKAERRRVLAAPQGGEEALREKAMRKTATKAVIVLFNAIAQKQAPAAKPAKEKKSGGALEAIEAAALEDEDAAEALGNAWARDDYLMDAEAEGWGAEDPEVELTGEGSNFLYKTS